VAFDPVGVAPDGLSDKKQVFSIAVTEFAQQQMDP
jgi:hypothetical protein